MINSSHIALTGGSNGASDYDDFYLFNLATDEWIEMPQVTVANSKKK